VKAVVDSNVIAYYVLGTPEFDAEGREFWQNNGRRSNHQRSVRSRRSVTECLYGALVGRASALAESSLRVRPTTADRHR
jgi:predicted nucleic acid-binding protein